MSNTATNNTETVAVFIVVSTALFVALTLPLEMLNAPAVIAVAAGVIWGEVADRLRNQLTQQSNSVGEE